MRTSPSPLRSLILCGAVAFSAASDAQDTSSSRGRVLDLREAIENALVSNRQLQIERINPEIARFTLRASYGIYDPIFTSQIDTESASETGGFDPANAALDAVFETDSEVLSMGLLGYLPSGLTYTVGGNYAHSSGTRNFLNFDSYRTTASVSVSQPLLRNFWIDQPRYLIQVNKRNLKISELGVNFVAMSVINLTHQAYYDLVFAWETLRVNQDLLDIRANFLRGIQRQVELGMMTALEEKLARSQNAAAATDLVTSSNSVSAASNNLKTLMGISGADWQDDFFIPGNPMLLMPETFDLHGSWKTGLQRRPDLLQLAVNAEKAALGVKFYRNQLFPSLNLIGAYGLKGSDAIQAFPPDQPEAELSRAIDQLKNQDAPNSMIGILFSMPITSTAERNNYKASKQLKDQAALLVRQKEEFILREISDAMDLARHSFQRAEAARTAAQFASEALAAEEQRLRGGAGSIFVVLQSQTDWARAKIVEIMARRDYNKALAQLYFTEGTLLERNQIQLDFSAD